MGIAGWLVVTVVVAGFLLLWWELRYQGNRIVNELIESGTLLADILEKLNDRSKNR